MSKENMISPKDRILLIGNPNVGKSVFFSELTGIHAISSNFVGTTVTFMEGHLPVGNHEYTLIDVPGIYSLEATSDAERVAIQFLNEGAKAIICVLDASNLERNLTLALDLKKYNIPIVYTLNLSDIAKRRGIHVNDRLLQKELCAPVIATVAVKKAGIKELMNQLEVILDSESGTMGLCTNCENCAFHHGSGDHFSSAKQIAKKIIRKEHTTPSKLDKLGDLMMKPMPGIPISFLVLAILIGVVVFGGRGLRAGLLLPLVNGAIVPFFRWLFASFLPEGMLLNILVGEFGIFVISFEWILALIFPYVLFFYIGFSFLEDSGYLPRMSVLFDNIMRKLSVQGGSLIYTIMAFGCAVPAIIGTRAATSRKERLVITAAICFAIPCISQTGALIALLSAYAWWLTPLMIVFGFLVFVTVSLIAGKFIKGKVDPLIIEVPNLLLPEPRAYFRKLLMRMKHFLKDAEIPMMVAIVIAALLAETGLLNIIAEAAGPFMQTWLGMPNEAVIALLLGIIRREMSVAPLLALNLNALQAFVGGVVSLLYLPCISVFAILAKEYKFRIAALIAVSTIVVALFVGGIVNQIGQLFM